MEPACCAEAFVFLLDMAISLCRSIRRSDSMMEHLIAATSHEQNYSVGDPLQTNPLHRVRARRRCSDIAPPSPAVDHGLQPSDRKRSPT
jgi:hypothetical protein